jgi:hypothetical protein
MGAPDLIGHLKSMGLRLRADGDRLLVEPKQAITDEARQLIRENKAALLSELARVSLPPILEHRIEFVARFHNFTPDELAEAKEIAAGDIEAATICFRHLLAKILASQEASHGN